MRFDEAQSGVVESVVPEVGECATPPRRDERQAIGGIGAGDRIEQ
jgi:hypothetical protein